MSGALAPLPVWDPSRRRLGGHPTWAGGHQISPVVTLFPPRITGAGWRVELFLPSPAEYGAYRPYTVALALDGLAEWLLWWESDPEGCLRGTFEGYELPTWVTHEPRQSPAKGAVAVAEATVSAASLGL